MVVGIAGREIIQYIFEVSKYSCPRTKLRSSLKLKYISEQP